MSETHFDDYDSITIFRGEIKKNTEEIKLIYVQNINKRFLFCIKLVYVIALYVHYKFFRN